MDIVLRTIGHNVEAMSNQTNQAPGEDIKLNIIVRVIFHV